MTELDQAARQILRGNDLGGYTVPTAGLYPFQWNWDSCLVALGWATFDEARAWAEIDSLLSAQWDDGMVPHIVFHKPSPTYFPGPDVWGTGRTPPTSGITQPPVAATVVRRLLETATDTALAEAKARSMLPKLFAWHRWFHTQRDPHGEGLVGIIHPWETGRDNAADWDAAMAAVPTEGVGEYQRRDLQHVDADQRPKKVDYDRYLYMVKHGREAGWNPDGLHDSAPFCVADIGINALLLRADRDLAALARRFGDGGAAASLESWIVRSEAGLQRLWHDGDGTYRSLDRKTGALVDASGSGAFLMLTADAAPADRRDRLLAMMDRWLAAVPYGVPSLAPADPRFDAKRYWRGPCWLVVNYLIADGCIGAGRSDLAERLRADSRAMVEKSGFWEYFDPTDGAGLGGDNFTWTAAMWLAWAGQ